MANSPSVDRNDPYERIRRFFGEELSHELIRRIAQAPDSHRASLSLFMAENARGIIPIPDLQPGQLRPVVSVHMADRLRGDSDPYLRSLSSSLAILLYAHEVVVDDPSSLLADQGKAVRRGVAEWLLAVRPLFDRGTIHFAPVTSMKVHPSNPAGFNQGGLQQVVRQHNDPEINDFLQAFPIEDQPDALFNLILDTLSHQRYVASWNQVHRLLKSRAEHAALSVIFEQLTPLENRRVLQLRRLLEIAFPDFLPDTRSLVSIRENDEVFADWRHYLALSLDSVAIADPFDQIEVRDARNAVAADLKPLQQKVHERVKGSTALQTLRNGTAGVGISAVAASAGLAVGGSFAAALAGATTAKALDWLVEYVKKRKDRRSDNAILDLTLMFEQR